MAVTCEVSEGKNYTVAEDTKSHSESKATTAKLRDKTACSSGKDLLRAHHHLCPLFPAFPVPPAMMHNEQWPSWSSQGLSHSAPTFPDSRVPHHFPLLYTCPGDQETGQLPITPLLLQGTSYSCVLGFQTQDTVSKLPRDQPESPSRVSLQLGYNSHTVKLTLVHSLQVLTKCAITNIIKLPSRVHLSSKSACPVCARPGSHPGSICVDVCVHAYACVHTHTHTENSPINHHQNFSSAPATTDPLFCPMALLFLRRYRN